MKKIVLFLCLNVLSFLTFCQKNDKDVQEIMMLMQAQEKAWNAADIAAFMAAYWQSDSLQYIGSKGIRYGWNTLLETYKQGYPDADAMGTLSFTLLHFDKLSPKAMYVTGQWHLQRKADTLGGYFTLLWKKMDGKWVIVADHSS